ncbi:uncharacterized protein F5147DRAFT_779593 [Suillus discolor]|uniref:DUF6533 domain-containing protein n=1 Tax=Suillus discolor TaxID=1912936 RepID=A0A9P7EW68_9AGAM|nr:uncharacterized protein F5147DRAFT_779593 [Suillus discolor]KAG2092655.1 hypothetical protein F5147DRAFT_779593 [Suillus discolor]
MTVVSNSPTMWPSIEFDRAESYYTVVSTVAVIYDWVLTFDQEVELVWKRRWSVMSVLYLILRYCGIIYAVLDVPGVSLQLFVSSYIYQTVACSKYHDTPRDRCCTFFVFQQWLMFYIANIILGVIMIFRLHAMYQRSRKMLIFLVVFFLSLAITSGVIFVIQITHLTAEELILSGIYQCDYEGTSPPLSAITWMLGTVWEILALYLSVRIAIKHFRERLSTGSIIEDCFMVLIKSHVFYFASFAAVASFRISFISPNLPVGPSVTDSHPSDCSSESIVQSGSSAGAELYYAVALLSALLQMFILGPRLVLSVREHSTRLVHDFDEATGMATLAFQESAVVSTGGGV